MESDNQGIKCSKFLDTETVIKKTETKIIETIVYKERQYLAQDILLEARTLLSCTNYNVKNPDCLHCHAISRGHIQRYECLARDEIRRAFIKK